MDIYLAIGFAPLVLGLYAVGRFRAVRYLLVIAGALALNGCLSLRLGGNDKPQTTVSRAPELSGATGAVAQPAGPPRL
jgi:hypothetical protein